MHRLQQMSAFAETAKHGSFAAAARELGAAPSTLAKAVARLEASLGVKLFHRTTRSMRLTPDGERLFERCARVLAELDDFESEAAGSRSEPAGLLRIDMPTVYGRRVILPKLAALARTHPRLALDVRLSDAFVDLIREGVDVAIRVGTLRDSRLVARRFDEQRLLLCAAPAYLAKRGTPRAIADLEPHAGVGFRMPSSGRVRPWQFRVRGRAVDRPAAPGAVVNDTDGLVAAALLGLGLIQVPHHAVEDEIARGELVEVLGALQPAPMPISVVYASGRLLPPRVAALLAALGIGR